MKRQEFKIVIHASRQKTWDVLWGASTYPVWASALSPDGTSKAITDGWKKDSKVLFLDGAGNGMSSVITEHIPGELMAFRHLHEIQDGVEQALPGEWTGATEIYRLQDLNGKLELSVDIAEIESLKDYFGKAFPKALKKVREMAESKPGLRTFALLW